MLSRDPLYFGFCKNCRTVHSLSATPAIKEAEKLMQALETQKRIDFEKPSDKPEEHSTEFLFGEARGKMFGVLVCEKTTGEQLTLKAFSGQYNGLWEVDGWVPPLFNVHDFWQLLTPVEREIKALGRELEGIKNGSTKQSKIQQQRKELSQKLMKQIHALYHLHNFKKERYPLTDLFTKTQGIPTGTGDCCAPKLLNFAAKNQLTPLGIAEFYWGKENRSVTRSQGTFYPACTDKCGPILGFLLCGI